MGARSRPMSGISSAVSNNSDGTEVHPCSGSPDKDGVRDVRPRPNRPLYQFRRHHPTPEESTAPRYLHPSSNATPSLAKRGLFPGQEWPLVARRVLSMNVALPGLTPQGESTPLSGYSPQQPFAALALHRDPGGTGGKYFSSSYPMDGDASRWNLKRREKPFGWDGNAGWDDFGAVPQDASGDEDEDGGRVEEFLEATKNAFAVGNKIRVGDVWTPVSDNDKAGVPEVRKRPPARLLGLVIVRHRPRED